MTIWATADASERMAHPSRYYESNVSAAPTRVLVVDDEPALAGMVATYLGRAGHDVQVAHDGPGAVDQARQWAPDVIVLDLGLPGMDGVEVCRQVRTFSDCFVLMVTARDDEVDVLIGLSVGADDYLTKPFRVRELVARVGVLLRRARVGIAPDLGLAPVRLGALTVQPATREVRIGEDDVTLTRTEFDLLAALVSRPRVVLSRRQLIDQVWGPGWVGDEHLVDTHIGHLRHKLGDAASGLSFIATVRGVGYRAVTPS